MSVQALKSKPESKEEWEACRELIDLLNRGIINSKKQLEHYKHVVCAKYGLKQVMGNPVILHVAQHHPLNENVRRILIKKPSRTTSGIAIVAVMTPPQNSCPWDCYYCPSAENAPRSYTGFEPSTMRSKQLGYNPFKIVRARITQLRKLGHPANKIHIVIQGGTFLARPRNEQEEFMIGILDGMSADDFPETPRSRFLEEAIARCEVSQTRNVGITFETRPDVCMERHIDRMLRMGGTWVEIGVQSLSDDVLRKVNRGHDVATSIAAIRKAKDAAFKVTIHMMPNLFATPEEDVAMFTELFENPDFRPDALKIYPTLTMPGTKLHEMWKKGEYIPYSEEQLVDVLVKVKSKLPPWVRIQRIQRDIPVQLVEDGIQHGNIREIIAKKMTERGLRCRCIRCREVGHQILKNGYNPPSDFPELMIREYEASKGKEHFISFEDADNDVIYGFLRLRFPSKEAHRPEITEQPTALIREVHVYGQEVAVGDEPLSRTSWQHRGLGKKLMEAAEQVAMEHGYKHVVVISAIGTREYYRKLGYKLEGPYMGKNL